MSEPKYGRLPIDDTLKLVDYVNYSTGMIDADVYAVLWWLADNGWDIVESKESHE